MRIEVSNSKQSLARSNESGWLMVETAVSIPIISMLLVAMCMIFWQGWKFYRSEVADWILQEEIVQAMSNISQQIALADSKAGITIKSGKYYDRIRFQFGRLDSSKKATYAHKDEPVEYFVDPNPEGQMQLYQGNSGDPITGKNVLLGEVVVTKFRCNLKRPDLVRIELAGLSLRTNHEFSLATEIFLPNMSHE